MLTFAPGVALAQISGLFPPDSMDSGIHPVGTELGSGFLAMPMERSVEVSAIETTSTLDLTIPVSADPWQPPVCRPLAYVERRPLANRP